MVIVIKYYRLTASLILKQNINYQQVSRKIGNSIQKNMFNQEKLKKLHNTKTYKYIFSPLVPFVKKTEYLSGEKYKIYIQSFDENTIVKFNYSLNNYEDSNIKVLNLKLQEIDLSNWIITEIETLTPAIVTVDNKPWVANKNSIDELMQKLFDNLEKKYKMFFEPFWPIKDDINKHLLFEKITILSNKPISRKYKDINLIGYKIKINVGSNDIAQKLAKVAIVQGLGEKNTIIGSGYVKYKKLRM